MAQEDKVECPECGYDVGTKENGTRIKAHKVDGEKCGGSDELVQRDEPTTDGIDKGGSYEAQDSPQGRSEEHTSELQSLMRSSYAVFCLKKKKKEKTIYI